MTSIDWSKFAPNTKPNELGEKFQDLCYDLLGAMRYKNLKWHGGPGDRGRDIEAIFECGDPDGEGRSEKWFVECKYRSSVGIPRAEINDKLAWADAEKPNVFLLITNSHLSPNTQVWLEKMEGDKRYRIRYWERKILENLLLGYPELIDKYFQKETVEKAETTLQRPYKFLDYFEEEDAEIFFGRDEDTSRLISQIGSFRLVLLCAKSGAGKTSIINAGLKPVLKKGYLIAYVRALDDPAVAIKKQVNHLLASPVSEGISLHHFLEQAVTSGQKTIVIFFDQFEEFFIRLSREYREAFIDEVMECYDDKSLKVKFVFSMREDYLAQMDTFKGKIPTIFHHIYRLERLSDNQAKEAITKPAKLVRIDYEPKLVAELLKELSREGVDPPQLQIVCNKLYDTCNTNLQDVVFLTKFFSYVGDNEK